MLVVFVVAATIAVAMAQFTIGPIVGFGLGVGREATGSDYETNSQGEKIKNENIYYSAGQGMKMGLAMSYSTETIGFGLDMGYSMGLDTEIDKSEYYSTYDSTWTNWTSKMKTSFMFLSPSIRIENSFGQLTPFCASGLNFALMPKSIYSSSYTYTGDSYEGEYETSYGIGMGGFGALGVKYSFGGGLSIVGQIRYDQLSLKAKSRKVTKYTINGEDELADWTTRDKETEFREDDTDDNYDDENSPNIDRTYTIPANSMTISVAMQYSFGGSRRSR